MQSSCGRHYMAGRPDVKGILSLRPADKCRSNLIEPLKISVQSVGTARGQKTNCRSASGPPAEGKTPRLQSLRRPPVSPTCGVFGRFRRLIRPNFCSTTPRVPVSGHGSQREQFLLALPHKLGSLMGVSSLTVPAPVQFLLHGDGEPWPRSNPLTLD